MIDDHAARNFGSRCLAAAAALWATIAPVQADERLAGLACRSVHLQYQADEATAFYNEVVVERSAPGTYFCVCGWDKGYFGLQELADGRKLAIFSVWDSPQNDPGAVAEERRVRLLHKDDKVRIGRFGSEGTGGQSFFDFEWRVGETYRWIVAAKPDGERIEYAGYLYLPEERAWRHLVTFSTITGGRDKLRGYYSFVEDFRRNKASAGQARAARFGNGRVRASDGEWKPIGTARFTADANPATNIDARIDAGRFRLATGGDTANDGVKLRELLSLPAMPSEPLADLPPLR